MGIHTGCDIRVKVRTVCEAIINSDWRSFRQWVKKEFYIPQKDKSRPILCSDSRIPIHQWLDLVNLWDTPESKAEADTNKQNRKQLMMHHTAGTRPYSMHRYDFEKEKGHQPNSFEFYCKTHKRRDQSWIDDESEQHAEKMSSALEELEVRNNPEEVNKIFEQEFADRLVGHGRVFGRGVGVKPSMVGYSSSSSGSRGRASTIVELELMKAKFEASEAEREKMQAEVKEFQQSVNVQLQELRQELSRRPPAMGYSTFQEDYCREHEIPWMSPISIPQSDSQQHSFHHPDFMARPHTRPAFRPTTSYSGVPQMSENVIVENTPIRPTGGLTMPFRGESQMPEDSNDETQMG